MSNTKAIAKWGILAVFSAVMDKESLLRPDPTAVNTLRSD